MRYKMVVLLRPNDEEGTEREWKVNVTASSELAARREVLERAWSQNGLVSRFLFIDRCMV